VPIEKPRGKFTIWPLVLFAVVVCVFVLVFVFVLAAPVGVAWQGEQSVQRDDSDSATVTMVLEYVALVVSFCQVSCKTTAQPSEVPRQFL
jgi:hypothetical protein